jgi:hypothetical protein
VGTGALDLNTSGNWNTGLGRDALGANTTGSYNTASGYRALSSNTTGFRNTASGYGALFYNTTGFRNTASGYRALVSNTTGYGNTASGDRALVSNTTGSRNVALGYLAGLYATTGNDNIFIRNSGVAGDSGKIRIGTQSVQTETFIAGISGNTVTGGVTVLANASGELGTIASSRRFKEDIAAVGETSERLLALRPVAFRYKQEVTGGEQPQEYGLIAEEVAEVFPELVVYDRQGRPETVRYHLLVPLLLAELQREEAALRQVQEQGRALLARLGALERERAGPGASVQ